MIKFMEENRMAVRAALNEINFFSRFEELSNRFDEKRIPLYEGLEYIDREEVMQIIQDLGYISKFNSKEKFYKVKEEQIGKYKTGVNISLKYEMVNLIWIVKEKKEIVLGLPWGMFVSLFSDLDYKIPNPRIGTYEDIEEILKVSFEMYEDFKKALMKSQS